LVAIAILAIVHLALFGALVNLGFGHHHRNRHGPLVAEIVPVDIAPPPPPKASEPKPKTIVKSPVVAPAPVVQTNVAPPPVVVAPAPQLPAPPAVSAAPSIAAPIASSGPVSIGKLAPMPGNPPLKYPVSARMRHEEGVVRLRIVVGTAGNVEDISVIESSGVDSLDKAAMDVVRRWRFFPPTRDGAAVTGVGIFPAVFKLS
jgi:protein TonB